MPARVMFTIALLKSAKSSQAHFANRKQLLKLKDDSVLLNLMDYGKALRLARALKGFQQQELAELAEIDASYISLIEQGKRTPSLKLIHKLSRVIGIPVHLFTFLAMESEDSELLDQNELTSIGESLTKLVLGYGSAPSERRDLKKVSKRA